jgi:hypothetical protein
VTGRLLGNRRSRPRVPSRVVRVPDHRREGSPGRLLLQFGASGLVAVLVVFAAGTYAARRVGERESVRDARALTELLAQTAIEPHLRNGILTGDTTASSGRSWPPGRSCA